MTTTGFKHSQPIGYDEQINSIDFSKKYILFSWSYFPFIIVLAVNLKKVGQLRARNVVNV